MDRFQRANIAYKLDGYMIRRPGQDDIQYFGMAKKELRKAIQRDLDDLTELTFYEYQKSKKKDFKP